MSKAFFKQREHGSESCIELESFIAELAFDDKGLLPVIVQAYDSKEVLMFAWVNEQTLRQTLATNRMCYWSRSRQKVWIKGEESGHIQTLKCLRADCDGDVLLAEVEQVGSACHTHRLSCFYWEWDQQAWVRNDECST